MGFGLVEDPGPGKQYLPMSPDSISASYLHMIIGSSSGSPSV